MSQKKISSIIFGIILIGSAMIFGYLFGANSRMTEIHMTETIEYAEPAPEEGAEEAQAGKTEAEVTGEDQTKLVDLNTADTDELQTLPGIGPKLAERIIDYRNTMGRFSSKEELKNVSGIGSKKYADLEQLITVGGLK